MSNQDTVKIKCLRGTRGDGKSLEAGKSYDLSPGAAKTLINMGKAELAGGKGKAKAETLDTKGAGGGLVGND